MIALHHTTTPHHTIGLHELLALRAAGAGAAGAGAGAGAAGRAACRPSVLLRRRICIRGQARPAPAPGDDAAPVHGGIPVGGRPRSERAGHRARLRARRCAGRAARRPDLRRGFGACARGGKAPGADVRARSLGSSLPDSRHGRAPAARRDHRAAGARAARHAGLRRGGGTGQRAGRFPGGWSSWSRRSG